MTTIEEVRDVVGATPFMTYEQARLMQELMIKHDVKDCLELGFAHGVSSCYIASILKSRGGGRLETIDNLSAKIRDPNISFFIDQLHLHDYIKVYYEQTSFNWFLLRQLEKYSEPYLDFCYVDGPHTWEVDGFAFLLVERLLKPNGIIVFDDLDWFYERSRGSLGHKEWFKKMPDEQRNCAQVRKIWELLVRPHPAFEDFWELGAWGIARKTKHLNY